MSTSGQSCRTASHATATQPVKDPHSRVRTSVEHVRGTGFPSLSRELAVIPPNTRDPNGYYAMLGLPPNASVAEVRKAYRLRAARHHPDGPDPDPEEFASIASAHAVLSDPMDRAAYHAVPEGYVWMDQQVRESIDGPLPDPMEATARPDLDYLRRGVGTDDDGEARRWYAWLIPTLRLAGYQAPVRLCLDDEAFGYDAGLRVFTVPRTTLTDWPTSRDQFNSLLGL